MGQCAKPRAFIQNRSGLQAVGFDGGWRILCFFSPGAQLGAPSRLGFLSNQNPGAIALFEVVEALPAQPRDIEHGSLHGGVAHGVVEQHTGGVLRAP